MNVSNFNEAIFDSLIVNGLGSLMSKGYKNRGVYLRRTPALGEYLEAELVSEVARRVVKISYLPPTENYADVLKFTIEDRAGKSFMVDDLLKLKGMSTAELNAIDLSAYSGALSERVAGCLAGLTSLTEGVLKEIMEGEVWVDVPIDWAGYR